MNAVTDPAIMHCAVMSGMSDGTVFEAAASFLAMWIGMMAAMMLPSLVPMLRRYRDALRPSGGSIRIALLILVVCAGYFAVWTAVGAAAFAVKAIQVRQLMLAHATPLAIGLVVLTAGALQFTPWKAHHLACCRRAPGTLPADAVTALRHGLRLGIHCSCACTGPTAILLAAGLMDLRAMAVVTTVITVEHLAPAGERAARAIGAAFVAAGLLVIARAAMLA